MNWGRVSFDASTHMLFEASGDSEVECVDAAVGDASEAESEDDALSCSDGSSAPDFADVQREVDAADGGRFDEDCDNVGGCFGRQQEDRGDVEEEDGVVDQCCGGRGTAVAPPEDVVGEAKGEMEDSRVGRESDRLFWEACLKS